MTPQNASGEGELLALAARCEAASEGTFKLDDAIYEALSCQGQFLHYSRSLDAAMTLVPEGHTVQLSDWDADLLRLKGAWQAIVLPRGARGNMTAFTFTNRCDHAATPALALTAAALRARAIPLNAKEIEG